MISKLDRIGNSDWNALHVNTCNILTSCVQLIIELDSSNSNNPSC